MATNQQAATVESQPTDNTPSATTDWHNLYAGLDGLDGRVDPQQAQALKLLDSDPNPKEARARVINQGRLSEELKTMDPEMIRNNWQGVKDAYVKHAFGSNLKNVDDVTLYGMIAEQQKAQRAPKQAHDEQTYGIIRSPTAWEKVSNGFDVYTHGLFHPALKPKMLHAEGVKSDWSDLPAMLGNMAGQTLLNPGNILTGAMLAEVNVAGSARKVLPEAYHAALRRFFTAQMIGQTSVAAPGVAKEWMNPNVSGAQATADTIGLGVSGVMAGFGVAAEFVPKEAAVSVMEGIKDKPAREAATSVNNYASQTPTPEGQMAFEVTADNFHQMDPTPSVEPKPMANHAEPLGQIVAEMNQRIVTGEAAKAGDFNAPVVEQPVVEPTQEMSAQMAPNESPSESAVGGSEIQQPRTVAEPSTPEEKLAQEEQSKRATAKSAIGEDPKTLKQRINANLGQMAGTMDTKAALREFYKGQERAATTALKQGIEAGNEAAYKDIVESQRPTVKQVIQNNLNQISGMMEKKLGIREFYKGQELAAKKAEVFTAEKYREMDAQSRADAEAIKKSLVETVNELPVSERGKFTQMIADTIRRPAIGRDPDGLYRRAIQTNFRILNHLEYVRKNILIDDLRESINKSLESKQIDVTYKKRIEDVMKRITFSKMQETTKDRLQGTLDYIKGKGEEHGVPNYVLNQVEQLFKIPAKDLPVNVLEGLQDKVELLANLGKANLKSRQLQYEFEKNEWTDVLKKGESTPFNSAVKEVAPGQDLSFADRFRLNAGNKLRKAGEIASQLDINLLGRDVVFDMLDGNAGYKGSLNKTFGRRFDSNYQNAMNYRKSFGSVLQPVFDAHEFNQAEREQMQVYAENSQEGGRQHLLDSGLTDSQIDEIVQNIKPKQIALIDAFRELGDKYIFPAVEKLMRDEYNLPVEKVNNYSPRYRDNSLIESKPEDAKVKVSGKGVVEFDDLSIFNELQKDFKPLTTKTEQGMTKSRVEGARGAIKMDFIDNVNRHINQVSHLLANQRDLKMGGEIARSELFKNKYGDLGRDYTLNFLDTIARQDGVYSNTRIGWVDAITKNSSVGVLGLRLVSQLKHLPNLALAAAEVRPDFLIEGIKESLTPSGWDFVNKNFSEVGQRYGGEPAIADLNEKTTWEKIQKGSFFLERGLDSTIARATVLGKYMQELHAEGKDYKLYQEHPIDTMSDAWNNALVTSRKVVTSPLTKDTPQAISRGAVFNNQMSVSKAFFQYQNTMLRQWAYMRHDIFDLGLRNMDVGRVMTGTLALTAVIAGDTFIVRKNRNMLRQLANSPEQTSDKDKSFEQEMFNETFRRVPFAGNYLSLKYGDFGIPVETTLKDIGQPIYQTLSGTDKYGKPLSEKQKKANLAQFIGGVGQAAGIPGAGTAASYLRSKALSTRNVDTSYLDYKAK